MSKLFDTLFSYGFHDTTISNIKVCEHQVKVYFNKGLYSLGKNGNETELTKPIVLVIDIDKNHGLVASQTVTVLRYSNKRFHKGLKRLDVEEIKESELANLFIGNVYYSDFNNTVLFEAFGNGCSYYINISECVGFKFE